MAGESQRTSRKRPKRRCDGSPIGRSVNWCSDRETSGVEERWGSHTSEAHVAFESVCTGSCNTTCSRSDRSLV
ncbi:hypothetical protein KGM_202777 [Danaus plexippus plexippus]|uniref:Uncharacterized protein n=1 Tax=Danaus plexippus plexippus TaxID=278856 RepID=A0A212EWZ9_DANPL|nr:hypothetical protein KGM_202777 [Danaus plexippus plexippus]